MSSARDSFLYKCCFWDVTVRHHLFQILTSGMTAYKSPKTRNRARDHSMSVSSTVEPSTNWAMFGHNPYGCAKLLCFKPSPKCIKQSTRRLKKCARVPQHNPGFKDLNPVFKNLNPVFKDLTSWFKDLYSGFKNRSCPFGVMVWSPTSQESEFIITWRVCH